MTRLLPVLAVLLVAGCFQAIGQPTRTPTNGPPSAATPLPTPTQSAAPASQTSPPAAPPQRTPAPQPSDDQPPLPPTARLTLPDGTTHAGALGSYFYGGAAGDAPWLPARVLTPIELAADTTVKLTLQPTLGFVRWSARYADAQDETGDVITQLAADGEGDLQMFDARFVVPPAGSWVLMVQLFFADDEGDAAYYWHLVVR